MFLRTWNAVIRKYFNYLMYHRSFENQIKELKNGMFEIWWWERINENDNDKSLIVNNAV